MKTLLFIYVVMVSYTQVDTYPDNKDKYYSYELVATLPSNVVLSMMDEQQLLILSILGANYIVIQDVYFKLHTNLHRFALY